MGLYESVNEYMKQAGMLTDVGGVVVGVSGGADSVALLRVLCQCRDAISLERGVKPVDALKINVIHINHMIRGEEADRDQQFVQELCQRLDVSFKVYREDIPKMARDQHLSEEEAGRIFRYQCFEKEADILSKDGTDAREVRIAVAHNKDDLAETVLFNMIRGSSLLGLSGIKPVVGRIIRPLLMTSRAEIEDYLRELGQDYITDSTNLTTDYTRNKIRLFIIPQLREINGSAVDHIVEVAQDASRLNQDIAAEISTHYYVENNSTTDREANQNSDISIEVNENNTRQEIHIPSFRTLSTLAKGELVLSKMEKLSGRRKDITREHIRSVCALADMESGKSVDLIYGIQARRSYDTIVLSIKPNNNRQTSNLEKLSKETGENQPTGTIKTEIIPYDASLDLSKKEYTKLIDCDKINFVPVLRTPQPDDFIVVSGEGGSKKLSRFFTHSKVDREKRESFPVVADGDEIIWVVGLRLSERYKVTGSTKRVMRITYTEK